MRSIRKQFGAGIYRVMGGIGTAVGAAGASAGGKGDPDVNRANKVWFAALVFLVLVTFIAVFTRGNSLGVQVILAGLWGLFIGGTVLFFLSRHLIITVFGAVIGGSIAKAENLADGVRNFGHVARDLTAALNQAFSPPPNIYNGSVVVFLLLLALSCLPAYKED